MAWIDRVHPQENTCKKFSLPKSSSSALRAALGYHRGLSPASN